MDGFVFARTNVAARGLEYHPVEQVINMELPESRSCYPTVSAAPAAWAAKAGY